MLRAPLLMVPSHRRSPRAPNGQRLSERRVVCGHTQVACRTIERRPSENGFSVIPANMMPCSLLRESLREPIMYGKPLKLTQEIRYLGMLLDRKLSWKVESDYWHLRRADA